MGLQDELRDAKQSAKTHEAICQSLIAENKQYRAALHIIAHMGVSGLSWQHDYEKCVNVAKEALET
jgi:flagellar biosynthesis chaperone FliJ